MNQIESIIHQNNRMLQELSRKVERLEEMQVNKLLTLNEAAKALNISRATLQRRIKKGLIEVIHHGRSPRISQLEINRYKNDCTT